METIILGIKLVLVAAGLLALVVLLTRWVIPKKYPGITEPAIPARTEKSNIHEAVLLVQRGGGRVLYANKQAQAWFGSRNEKPNLERLARRTQPDGVFLSLCAAEGHTQFTIDGRLAEGRSYYVPYVNPNRQNATVDAILVTFHWVQITAIGSLQSPYLGEALNLLATLSRQINHSLDLEQTLASILSSIEGIIPADFSEITLWDSTTRRLNPYRFIGVAGVNRKLQRATDSYDVDTGYSGWLIRNRTPLFIPNVDTHREVRPAVDRKSYPFHSYLGLPLEVNGDLVGTLEMASLHKAAFTENDLEVLRILSSGASVALKNSIQHLEDQKRIRELSGLVNLLQDVSHPIESRELYEHLVNGIRTLLDVKTLGFLTYNESKSRLEAQQPFLGIPAQMLDLYHLPISPGSTAEQIWLAQETILTEDAGSNTALEPLGMNHMAKAAGIQNMVLLPLSGMGGSLGYLQVADKLNGQLFDGDDLRLLETIAAQVSAIIENAVLVRESRERAQRSEALRRVASLTGSTATLNEILEFSLRELARLLRADIGTIYLLEENVGELRLHPDLTYGIPADLITILGKVGLADQAYWLTAAATQQPWLSGEKEFDEQTLNIYQPVFEALCIQSALVVPLVARGQGVGEIMLASTKPEHFERNDLILVSTTASQLASSIEKAAIFGQTDQSLQRRVAQLQALIHISRELNATMDWERLLKLIYDEAIRTTQADFGNMILFEWEESGEATREVVYSIGTLVAQTLSSLDDEVLAAGEARVISDPPVGNGEGEQTLFASLKGVYSALIAPISYQGHSVGLIHLYSRIEAHFDETALEIVRSLTVQAAIALGNAHRYQEQFKQTELLTRRVETMAALLKTSQNIQLATPLIDQLEAIAYAIQETTEFNSVLISEYDDQSQCLIRKVGVGIPLDALAELKEHTIRWALLQETLRPEFRLSRSYYIPFEQVPFVFPAELHSIVLTPFDAEQTRVENAWHPEDTLVVPLLTMDDQPLGLISVDAPRNGKRPDRPMIESLELFASQAALTLEIHHHLAQLRSQIDRLEAQLDQQKDAVEDALQRLPIQDPKEAKRAEIVQQLGLRYQRMRTNLDITESVLQQSKREAILAAVGQGMLAGNEFDSIIIAEPSEGGLRLVNAFGLHVEGITIQTLLGQRNPLWYSLQSGKNMQVPHLELNEDWKSAPLLSALKSQSFITLIISSSKGSQSKPDAVVLASSANPMIDMTSEDIHAFELMILQVGEALRNLRLFDETNQRLRDVNLLLEFNLQLASFDTGSILQTLVNNAKRVLPAASGVMVAMWVAHQQILEPRYAVGYSDVEKIMQIRYRAGEALPGQAFDQGKVLRIDEVNFFRDYNLQPEQLVLYRDANQGLLPVSTLIVPLMTQDTRLGVLVLDNFQLPAAFTKEDQDLVISLAGQAALALENVRLYRASEERSAQLQALTQVAGTMTSSLLTSDLINTLLDKLATVVPYTTGTLWLRHGSMLTVRSARGFPDYEQREGLMVAEEDSLLLKDMVTTKRPLSVGDVRLDSRFPALAELPTLSWLAAPLLLNNEVIGLLVLEKTEANFYTPAHIQVLETFAGQAAIALENATLYQDSLKRAEELANRSRRLALLNRLSTELSGSLDLSMILSITVQELERAIHCSVVSVIIFDVFGKPFLQAESPNQFGSLPQSLPASPIFDRLEESLGIFITEDITLEEELQSLRTFFKDRSTRSLMILPLAVGITLNGVVLLHTSSNYRFTTEEVELARTITNQAAVAVQNARLFVETERLFAETERRSMELSTLFDFGVSITQELDQTRLLNLAFENVARLIPCDSVMVVLAEGEKDLLVHHVDFGERKPSFTVQRTGKSFSEYILETNSPLLIPDAMDPNRRVKGAAGGIACRCWLGVPLTARGVPRGVISVQSETPAVFGEAQVRLLGQIANQFSVALDNAYLFSTFQSYATDQENVVKERTEQLAREHKRIQTLLSIITELSASLDLDMVLNRTLSVVRDTISAAHSVILLLQPDGKSLFIRASQGYTTNFPKGGQVSSLGADEGLVGWVVQNRDCALIHDLSVDDRWLSRNDLASRQRSAIAVPLLVGEEILGALIFYHPEVAQFSEDALVLIQAVAKQIAVAVNNAQLYSLIRDQAERLGDMLRTQHVETSRSQAILEAVADGVLVTDARRRITLFNASAENILGLSREKVLGNSLESFIGLFGNAAKQWVETIRIWSEEPEQYQPGDLYAERIELDNQRVVAVHLSPVRLRHDFLGTVSIFRDITHEVEVDRLKSEFVATVSHELRTPMTSIKGYVDLLLMGATGPVSEQQGQFLRVVKQNTERLAILVNDLLEVSRIEAGKVTLSLQALDLGEIADQVLANITRRMEDEDRPINLEKAIPHDLPLVTGDRDRVIQIVDNLVANAYQYTPIHGRITIRARQDGGFVQMDVEDTGIGIKPEESGRIFERFYRGEDALVMATSGNGLGLSIVQKLVELHKGKIWFESKGVRGEGSTFSFTLPLHKPG